MAGGDLALSFGILIINSNINMYAPPYTGPPPPPGAESHPKVKSTPWVGNSSAKGAKELIKERKRK